jgi:transposase InsO family protein
MEMTGLLGVSRCVYYKWFNAGISNQSKGSNDAELIRLIREIVIRHHRRYDSPRVKQELRNKYGKRVSLKKEARLMRENGLNACRSSQIKRF